MADILFNVSRRAERPGYLTEAEEAKISFYRRLEDLLADVRSVTRLQSAIVRGFLVMKGLITPLKMFPLFSIQNPIKPTSYPETTGFLNYPVDGVLPGKQVETDNPRHWRRNPYPQSYTVPDHLYFTINSQGKRVSVDRNSLGIVVFWEGMEKPGLYKAKNYPVGETNPYHPYTRLIRGKYALMVGNYDSNDYVSKALPALGLDLTITPEIKASFDHIRYYFRHS